MPRKHSRNQLCPLCKRRAPASGKDICKTCHDNPDRVRMCRECGEVRYLAELDYCYRCARYVLRDIGSRELIGPEIPRIQTRHGPCDCCSIKPAPPWNPDGVPLERTHMVYFAAGGATAVCRGCERAHMEMARMDGQIDEDLRAKYLAALE